MMSISIHVYTAHVHEGPFAIKHLMFECALSKKKNRRGNLFQAVSLSKIAYTQVLFDNNLTRFQWNLQTETPGRARTLYFFIEFHTQDIDIAKITFWETSSLVVWHLHVALKYFWEKNSASKKSLTIHVDAPGVIVMWMFTFLYQLVCTCRVRITVNVYLKLNFV